MYLKNAYKEHTRINGMENARFSVVRKMLLFGSGMVKGVLGSKLDDLFAASDNNDAWLISCLS